MAALIENSMAVIEVSQRLRLLAKGRLRKSVLLFLLREAVAEAARGG